MLHKESNTGKEIEDTVRYYYVNDCGERESEGGL